LSPGIQDQPEQHRETVSQKKKSQQLACPLTDGQIRKCGENTQKNIKEILSYATK
jgi:hypothetical protein